MGIISREMTRIAEAWQNAGWSGVTQRLREVRWKVDEARKYQAWIATHSLSEPDRERIRGEVESMKSRPLISVVLPVFNVEEKFLRLCIESVIKQLYPNWELCVADDCSPDRIVRQVLEEYRERDERIKVVFRSENGHISAASNSAIELATGEFIALLDHDDEFSEDALFHVAKQLNEFPDTQMIFSDEDLIDVNGRRHTPKFKPDFSRDLMYSVNHVTHLCAYSTELVRRLGGFRVGFEGSQDYDLALRVMEHVADEQIRHIPRILYHWRTLPGSVAFAMEEKPYAHERARIAIREHLERTGKNATVEEARFSLHRVRYELPEKCPLVSVVFSVSGDAATVDARITNIVELTGYEDLEIICVSGEDYAPAELPHVSTIIRQGGPLSAQLNAAAASCTGEVLFFCDIGLLPLEREWLGELISFVIQDEIGAVAGKLLAANKTVLHAGIIVGAGNSTSIAHHGFSRDFTGSIGRNILVSNFSAVSAACLGIRRSVFGEACGFDLENLPDHLFDIDLCLRLRERGYRIVLDPYAELLHTGATGPDLLLERPSGSEVKYFLNRWRDQVAHDPFYNPNLSKKDASFSIQL